MEELHRVLKPKGNLWATAEYLKRDEFLDAITKTDLLRLVGQKGKI